MAEQRAALGRLRRRVWWTRAIALTLVIGGVVVGTLVTRVDYADWATRAGVVRGSGSPAAAAASGYVEALAGWLTRPDPDTWQALAGRVVPERRGRPGGQWPWGPPVTVEAGLSAPIPPGATVLVTGLAPRLPVIPAGASRVTACAVEVGFTLTIFGSTGERTETPVRMVIRLLFSDVEKKWLVDP